MDPNFVRLKDAMKETKQSYFRIWRMVVSDQVEAMKVRRKGGRRIVWLVNLPKLKKVLSRPRAEPAFEIVEKVSPR